MEGAQLWTRMRCAQLTADSSTVEEFDAMFGHLGTQLNRRCAAGFPRCSWQAKQVLLECRRLQLQGFLAAARAAHADDAVEAAGWLSQLALLGTFVPQASRVLPLAVQHCRRDGAPSCLPCVVARRADGRMVPRYIVRSWRYAGGQQFWSRDVCSARRPYCGADPF